jgi:uncharacterized protein (TIGR02231 family)
LTFLFSLAALTAFAAAEGEVVAEVRTVDFYPMGARFVFQVKAAPGKNFALTLPGAFSPEDVRFVTRSDVASLRVESLLREEWTPPALALLKSRVEVKDRELKLLQGHKTALEQTKAMIDSPLPKGFDGKSLLLYIEDAQAMRVRIENDLVDLDLEIEKAAKELNVLQGEYVRRSPSGAGNIVRIEGISTTENPLIFEAFTYAAGWRVQYDMNLDSATGDIDAAMRARAWQKTGIDVAGEFSFHTRQPSFAINPPDLRPLAVNLRSQAAPRAKTEQLFSKSLPVNMMMAQAGSVPPPPSPEPMMTATLADVSVKGKGDLKGDGTPEDVALGEFTLKSVPVLVSIPEQSREAWIIASMDSIPAPLLAGGAELAVDGAATGKSAIPEYGMGQTYLPFGMASRLTSKKNRLVGKEGSSWLGKGITEDGYTLEITSGMEAEREVTIKDRIPLSVNDKISVEVTKIDPAPAERDKENKLTWKISVKPGETKKIVVEYTLKYPGDEALEYR